MKTKIWTPPAGSAPLGSQAGEPASPVDWMKTPVLFVTLKSQPEELELVSGIYQVWKHMRDRVPFTLTLRNGHVLASLSPDEFLMDETFRTPFVIFDKLVTLECNMAVQATLAAMDARLREAEAARAQQAAQGQAHAGASPGAGEQRVDQPVAPRAAVQEPTERPAPAQAPAPAEQAAPVREAARDDIRSVLSATGPQTPRVGQPRRRP